MSEKESIPILRPTPPQNMAPPSSFLPQSGQSPSHKQLGRVRPNVSNVIIFIIIVVCIFLPSPLTFSNFPSNLLNSAQPNAVNESSTTPTVEGNALAPATVDDQPASPVIQNAQNTSVQVSDVTDSESIEKLAESLPDEEENTKKNVDANEASTSPPADMEQCGRTILFTGPRHGSTWFLDCVENCSFSIANNGESFGDLNFVSELWNNGQPGPIVNISVDNAIKYVQHNLSVKLFPTPFRKRNDQVMQLVQASYQNGIKMVLLTRKPEAASKSFAIAKDGGIWNANSMGKQTSNNDSVKIDLPDGQREGFINMIKNHYKLVDQKLTEYRIPYDTLDYDDIKLQKYIILPNNRCYVRSCNYR